MDDNETLQSLAGTLLSDLKDRQPRHVEGISEELHESAPFLPKQQWARLGDALKKAEQPSAPSISGEQWISLRCDGTGFSKYLRMLRRKGILEEGFSETFAAIC